ncbi:hypothetical protein [Allosaccharopolyspora coralli]|uniref:hypothetical protein n=1 Tax=Allosaccharopolyspora coralli TaxID=2665642 RepID=UPI00165201B5|nr:hypothetical protein [Allosaccharopolyspora coralli]
MLADLVHRDGHTRHRLSIFFLAFLPHFVTPGQSLFSRMIALSAVFMAMTFVLYGSLAAIMRDRVLSRPKVMAWMRRTFAAAFVGLGHTLALTGRVE